MTAASETGDPGPSSGRSSAGRRRRSPCPRGRRTRVDPVQGGQPLPRHGPADDQLARAARPRSKACIGWPSSSIR